MSQYTVKGTNRFGLVVYDSLHFRDVTLDNVTQPVAIGTQYSTDEIDDVHPVMVESDKAGCYTKMYFGELVPF